MAERHEDNSHNYLTKSIFNMKQPCFIYQYKKYS